MSRWANGTYTQPDLYLGWPLPTYLAGLVSV